MTLFGYMVLIVGAAGFALTTVPVLANALPQLAALPVPPFVWAVVGAAGLLIVMTTRRPRD